MAHDQEMLGPIKGLLSWRRGMKEDKLMEIIFKLPSRQLNTRFFPKDKWLFIGHQTKRHFATSKEKEKTNDSVDLSKMPVPKVIALPKAFPDVVYPKIGPVTNNFLFY